MGVALSGLDIQVSKDSSPKDFNLVKSFSDKNIGSIEMFKHNARSEYMIRKQVELMSLGDESLLKVLVRKLKDQKHPNLQKITEIGEHDGKLALYFEFSRINLLDVMKRCRQKSQKIPENEVWRVLRTMVELGSFFEEKLEHHPSITLQNIFVIGDEFKLVHPYVYDSYLTEVQEVYSPVLTSNYSEVAEQIHQRQEFILKNLSNTKVIQAHEYNKEKIRINVIQTGLLLLSLGTLENQQNCGDNLQGERLVSSFEIFSKSYSNRLTTIVKEMVFSQSFDDELTFTDLKKEFAQLFTLDQGAVSSETIPIQDLQGSEKSVIEMKEEKQLSANIDQRHTNKIEEFQAFPEYSGPKEINQLKEDEAAGKKEQIGQWKSVSEALQYPKIAQLSSQRSSFQGSQITQVTRKPKKISIIPSQKFDEKQLETKSVSLDEQEHEETIHLNELHRESASKDLTNLPQKLSQEVNSNQEQKQGKLSELIIKRKPKITSSAENPQHLAARVVSHQFSASVAQDSTLQNLTLKNSASQSSLLNPTPLSKKIDFSYVEKNVTDFKKLTEFRNQHDTSLKQKSDQLVFAKPSNQDQDSSNVSTTTVKKIMKSSIENVNIPEKRFHSVTPSVKHRSHADNHRLPESKELKNTTYEFRQPSKVGNISEPQSKKSQNHLQNKFGWDNQIESKGNQFSSQSTTPIQDSIPRSDGLIKIQADTQLQSQHIARPNEQRQDGTPRTAKTSILFSTNLNFNKQKILAYPPTNTLDNKFEQTLKDRESQKNSEDDSLIQRSRSLSQFPNFSAGQTILSKNEASEIPQEGISNLNLKSNYIMLHQAAQQPQHIKLTPPVASKQDFKNQSSPSTDQKNLRNHPPEQTQLKFAPQKDQMITGQYQDRSSYSISKQQGFSDTLGKKDSSRQLQIETHPSYPKSHISTSSNLAYKHTQSLSQIVKSEMSIRDVQKDQHNYSLNFTSASWKNSNTSHQNVVHTRRMTSQQSQVDPDSKQVFQSQPLQTQSGQLISQDQKITIQSNTHANSSRTKNPTYSLRTVLRDGTDQIQSNVSHSGFQFSNKNLQPYLQRESSHFLTPHSSMSSYQSGTLQSMNLLTPATSNRNLRSQRQTLYKENLLSEAQIQQELKNRSVSFNLRAGEIDEDPTQKTPSEKSQASKNVKSILKNKHRSGRYLSAHNLHSELEQPRYINLRNSVYPSEQANIDSHQSLHLGHYNHLHEVKHPNSYTLSNTSNSRGLRSLNPAHSNSTQSIFTPSSGTLQSQKFQEQAQLSFQSSRPNQDGISEREISSASNPELGNLTPADAILLERKGESIHSGEPLKNTQSSHQNPLFLKKQYTPSLVNHESQIGLAGKETESRLMAKIQIDSDKMINPDYKNDTSEISKLNSRSLSLVQNFNTNKPSQDKPNFDFSKIPRKGVICGAPPVIQNTPAAPQKSLKMRSSSSTTEIIGGHSFTQATHNQAKSPANQNKPKRTASAAKDDQFPEAQYFQIQSDDAVKTLLHYFDSS